MALRRAAGSCCWLVILVGSLAQAGSVDFPPLGQWMCPYGGPILEYPQPTIWRLNATFQGPIRFNPQDALHSTSGLADILPVLPGAPTGAAKRLRPAPDRQP